MASKNNFKRIRRIFESDPNQKETLDLKEIHTALIEYKKEMAEHRKILRDVVKVNENVEQTLLNVLAAIRQNEYLHTWAPAQKGHPEMKFAGLHPLQTNQKGAYEKT